MHKGIRKAITPSEAERAIYIDYEGNIQGPPVLLGWMVEGEMFGSIIDPEFAICALRYRARHIGVDDHRKLALQLLDQVITEKRRIVSWSEHDCRILSDILGEADARGMRRRYCNAIPIARKWHWHTSGKHATDGSLSYFMELVGYEAPAKYGQGVVGNALRKLKHQLAEGRTYENLTRAARSGWQSVVKHNMHDLQGMALVVTQASEALDTLRR